MIRKQGVRVPPLSIDSIRRDASNFRQMLALKGCANCVKIIEFVLPKLNPEFVYDIRTKAEMGEDHARTYPDRMIMEIREDVYENALQLNAKTTDLYGRDNFTLAHELGHLIMHRGVANYARNAGNSPSHKIFEDSEWQADTFAAEFLMPHDLVKACSSINQVQTNFLVSYSAAECRARKVNKM